MNPIVSDKILVWLDDERPMPKTFTHWAKTAQEAIELLKTGQVVKISLDHDIGENNGTGYDVAKWIEEAAYNGTLKPLYLRVHSQNVVGRQNIIHALQAAKRAWMNHDTKEIHEAQQEEEEMKGYKHRVKILKTFTHKFTIGALVVEGKEIAPAEERENTFAEGQECEFRTKKEAQDFVKFHGKDKVAFVS